jgi:hypothetical protein
MNIPTIGGTRGIFEIFVPGVFLLLNFGISVYLLPIFDQRTRDMISAILDNPILDLIIAICFGYLIGILLRLLKTDYVDKLSSRWLIVFDKNARKKEMIGRKSFFAWLKRTFSRIPQQSRKPDYKLYATEEFPYIGWLEHVVQEYLSTEALEFYKNVWGARNRGSNKQNKQFFNFCKIVVSSYDERAANEIYAAEALTRYIAGMFYALMAASLINLFTFVYVGLDTGQWMTGLLFIVLTYLVAIFIIVPRFRKMRIREVEVVFATSFKNRQNFEEHNENEEVNNQL